MSFIDKFKKKSADPADPRRSGDVIAGGRRRGESDNPYLSARRTWNEHTRKVMQENQTWKILGILSLMIALGGVGGAIHVGNQSKFVPYVIEVDKLGEVRAVAAVQRAGEPTPAVVRSAVSNFIADSRMVTPDLQLQRKAVFRVYSKLAAADPATMKMNEHLNGKDTESPFKRAEKVMVSTEIKTVLPQTPETWQVDWVEVTRDRQGVKLTEERWRALVTVYTAPPSKDTTEQQIQDNPMGIHVRDYSWSKQL